MEGVGRGGDGWGAWSVSEQRNRSGAKDDDWRRRVNMGSRWTPLSAEVWGTEGDVVTTGR